VVGYQDATHHRVTATDPGGCAPARAEPSVDVTSHTSVRHGGRDAARDTRSSGSPDSPSRPLQLSPDRPASRLPGSRFDPARSSPRHPDRRTEAPSSLRSSIAGVTGSGHPAPGELCRRREVPRWRRADRCGAGPPGAGAAGGGGDDRGRGQRPGGREAVPGLADVGEPVAAGPGCGRPGGAGLQGGGRRPVQTEPDQVRELEAVLDAGPAAAGYADQCWTLARIADQVWRRFGMEYALAGWMCCCTGSGGACRSRRAARPSGTRRRSPGGGRRPGLS
jgi:hypothetical protein